MRPRVGVLAAPQWPVPELPATARAVEAAGFDELWFAEDCFLHGGLTAAATALAVTERLTVGVGLLPAAVRNPAIAAMEIATLCALHPGRVEVAFGHGVEAWMRQIGARPPDRLVMLEEVVRATRALLHGEAVTTDWSFVRLRDVRLEPPPDTPPRVLVGTTGERGIAIAARTADGLVVPEGSSEEALGWAKDLLGEGTLVAYTWLRIGDDAHDALSPVVEKWRGGGLYPALTARAGELEELAVGGTPEECAAAVERRARAGAAAIVLMPVGPDPLGQVSRFGAEALPLLGRG